MHVYLWIDRMINAAPHKTQKIGHVHCAAPLQLAVDIARWTKETLLADIEMIKDACKSKLWGLFGIVLRKTNLNRVREAKVVVAGPSNEIKINSPTILLAEQGCR